MSDDLDPVGFQAALKAFNAAPDDCDGRSDGALEAAIRAWEQAKWRKVDAATPDGQWLITAMEGEKESNITWLRRLGGNDEWIDIDGRTTVTHHSFSAPSHFQLLPPPMSKGER